ncbi:MAG: phosphohydrolase [Deltaproteobacteria bacterium CG23_combo_of_CG06-09_8_20_14_all_51_20]|nr:HD domain-containing protein [bacterium]OIP42433.1 MAG: phosphohydrolase [Desulfobacteraceae bacterium CG2_30_51_40]PIP44933.1 MAG: phosphohydrolase [Deltaproteobacteria bacterium CG23_combo_of_CG06-09_8_20_14_all_51_20]PIY22592.1 MAG: phosphohydrolase [Deltaproteobacteria bacterium CG_4_10_14_3_um_filter_51_14]PJB34376.1 MAG: phosphohydrolase [Deltaproteobacteria bacterium CG_4_9_14_3_um_filter_51_14]
MKAVLPEARGGFVRVDPEKENKSYGNAALLDVRLRLDEEEGSRLSPWACRSRDAVRKETEPSIIAGHRQQFSIDGDRILHSHAYSRYIDKTQVFYLIKNDHITHRVLHVQFVSKIARTIGRLLRLNEDLIEAIALGHDIGHTPFGHDGERFLSDICVSRGIGFFHHNIQSVRFLRDIERKGRGWNLTLQVLDGILCHDGEIHEQSLVPVAGKSFETLEDEIAAKSMDPGSRIRPMTLEGCVVRMADTISYIGRDIEDAIRLEIISRDDIPASCRRVLGDTNGTIVYTLVQDLVASSLGKTTVSFSEEVSEALKILKEFNWENIYGNPRIKGQQEKIRLMFELLFEKYLDDYISGRDDSDIFLEFLDGMSDKYVSSNAPAAVVRDFIAGMTDDYFLAQCRKKLFPSPMEQIPGSKKRSQKKYRLDTAQKEGRNI